MAPSKKPSLPQWPLCLGGDDANGPLFLTCEHATNRVPPEIEVTTEDSAWLRTHWAWDKGATDVVEALVEQTDSSAVLAIASRLVCDTNRVVQHENWIRQEMEGYTLSFNRNLDIDERERRRLVYYEPYHAAIDQTLASRLERGAPPLLIAIHSFTPTYAGENRWMQMGVIFDECVPEAHALRDALVVEGYSTALNAPYSGALGQMYSPRRHGRAHRLRYLELEMRHDLFETPEQTAETVDKVSRAIRSLVP
ncbi:MAG: N-formylglutamate amidohydrolase [Myxococcota bacterium]|nr:N-formylglutamate amidohydrolase [Myxococcota bacterium]